MEDSKDPLQFLTEFIENNGWVQFKKEFIPTENDPYFPYYDSTTECINIPYQTEAGYEYDVTFFANELKTHFVAKMREVRLKITNYLASIKDIKQRTDNLSSILRQLEHFQNLILTKPNLAKYAKLLTLENFIIKLKSLYNYKKIDGSFEYEQIVSILENFGNATKKITQKRREGHDSFEITKEYDVQDLLYVILKSVFPNLINEDPISKVGSKSTKIDLILREQGILIEVKILKQESDENKIIDDLKRDIESYHVCPWLNTLFCFIYDPSNLIKDKHDFEQLEGERAKNGHTFDVKVIIQS